MKFRKGDKVRVIGATLYELHEAGHEVDENTIETYGKECIGLIFTVDKIEKDCYMFRHKKPHDCVGPQEMTYHLFDIELELVEPAFIEEAG